jgi:deazaflavin-dependent oxidoreductase (nitroreductase family)
VDIEARAKDLPSDWVQGHVRQYLESDGAEVDHPAADRLILLYTTGRRSGDIRRAPLVSFGDGDDLIVVASRGGAPSHPHWYLNLTADREVWVRRRHRFFPATATVLDGEERDEHWRRIVSLMPTFGRYQEKAGRQIPLVRLAPR